MPKKIQPSGSYIVANPRGIPAGRYIVRVGERRYFEGDAFEGVPPERFIRDGFVVEVKEVTDGKE